MTAKEMFEQLGYIERPNNEYDTDAELIYDTQKRFYHSIYFDKDKTIDISSSTITLDLLKAINKQIEELGWLDEKTTN